MEALQDGVSKQSPREPIETSMPTLRQRRVKISDVYWAVQHTSSVGARSAADALFSVR